MKQCCVSKGVGVLVRAPSFLTLTRHLDSAGRANGTISGRFVHLSFVEPAASQLGLQVCRNSWPTTGARPLPQQTRTHLSQVVVLALTLSWQNWGPFSTVSKGTPRTSINYNHSLRLNFRSVGTLHRNHSRFRVSIFLLEFLGQWMAGAPFWWWKRFFEFFSSIGWTVLFSWLWELSYCYWWS